MKGFINIGHNPGGSLGGPVYLAGAGSASAATSSTAGHVIRVLGHNYGSNAIYFNPSNDWIVRA
jgi:hypothetical protein